MKSSWPVLLLLLSLASPHAATDETFELEPFGKVTLYHQTPRPSHVKDGFARFTGQAR